MFSLQNPEWPFHSVQTGWFLPVIPMAQDGTGSKNAGGFGY